jgi:preprotein translocase subunit SecY
LVPGANAPAWLQDVALLIGPGQPLYILLFSSLIIFFSFFYTALMYNPKEVADNLKKGGAYLPGIRPGEHTAKYIDSVTTRLTLIGGVYITLICLMPQFLNVYFNVPFLSGWNITVDCGCCDNGFYGSGAVSSDVAAI